MDFGAVGAEEVSETAAAVVVMCGAVKRCGWCGCCTHLDDR